MCKPQMFNYYTPRKSLDAALSQIYIVPHDIYWVNDPRKTQFDWTWTEEFIVSYEKTDRLVQQELSHLLFVGRFRRFTGHESL